MKLNLLPILLIVLSISLVSAFDFPHTIVTIDYTGNITNLSEMQDVNIPSPSDNQLLEFDAGTNKWIASTVSLTDTNASTACSGTDYLAGNGSCLDPSVIGGDTNETTRFNVLVGTDCGAGNYSYGFDATGLIQCREDSSSSITDTNASTACGDGEFLNGDGTCDAGYLDADGVDDDTTYTNGTGISLTGTTFSIILSYFQGLFIELTDSFGGEVSGTYDNLVLDNDALDDQYVELTDLPLANLTTPYCENITGAVSNLCTLTDTDTTYSDNLNFTNGANYWNDTKATFNKTYGDTLYADISVTGDNSSWNETYADIIYSTIDEPLWSSNQSSYVPYIGATANLNLSSYGLFAGIIIANLIGGDGAGLNYTETNVIKPTSDNEIDLGESENGRFKNLYLGGNATADKFIGNGSLLTGITMEETDPYWTANQSSYSTKAVADTLYADISVTGDNSSWNESYADSLYAGIEWDYNQTTASINILNGTGLVKDWNETGYITNQTQDLSSYIENNTADWTLNISKLFPTMFYTLTNSFAWTVTDDGSDVVVDFSSIGGTNSLFIKTAGTFLEMIANPGPANDYEMFAFEETQGVDTVINFYEGGVGHNRIWNSGSMRIGGGKSSMCSNLTSDVDCNTATTGADIVVQDDGWFGGKLFSSDWSNVSVTESQISDLESYRLQSWDNITGIPVASITDGDTTHFALVDTIYDFVIGKFTEWTHLSNFTDDLGNRGYTSNLNFTNDANYYNSTNPQPDSNYTEDEIEAFIFDNDNTANLNMSGHNITSVDYMKFDGSGYMYDNSTCVIIKGYTSNMYIC